MWTEIDSHPHIIREMERERERERETERQRKTRSDGGGERSRVEGNMSVTVRQRDLAALRSEGADFKETSL